MSRHRYIRKVSIGDDDYDDTEGQSFDDRNFAVSPGTMDMYLYKRMEGQTLNGFIKSEIPEENDDQDVADEASGSTYRKPTDDDNMFQMESQQEQTKKKTPDTDRNQEKQAYKSSASVPVVIKTPVRHQAPSKPIENEPKTAEKKSTSKNAEHNDTKPNDNNSNAANKILFNETKKSKDTPVKQSIKPNEPPPSKPTVNLVVVGHVDAGKSTLMGHLLFQIGQVNDKVMHKNKQESHKAGKGSFAFAWILDETEEERSRGVTIDVAQTKFETEKKFVNLLDAPGHKDFIPNMITGASVADCAILVINSTSGEFETGFESGGQTQEHSILIRSMGISQLAVAVNKMDTCDWSAERFDDICKKLGMFLKQAGFKENELIFIPCSGLLGVNLTKKPDDKCALNKWYTGGTILDCINNFLSPERRLDKPFRMSISDIFKAQSSFVSLAGKCETGCINVGDKVTIMPSGQIRSIKSISHEDQTFNCAYAGDSVVLDFANLDPSTVAIGDVICDCLNEPIKYTNLIKGRIVLFTIDVPLTIGYPIVFHYKSAKIAGTVKRIISQLNKSTGEVIKDRPRLLTSGMSALVEIQTQKPFCAELFQDFKELGRFMLRSGNSTVAAGLITERIYYAYLTASALHPKYTQS